MDIRRITDQQTQSLDEFYSELATLGPDNMLARPGAKMLGLVRHLREVEGPSVWAITSHETLYLIAGDDYRLPALVSIACSGDWFHLRYLMPQREAPWPGAYVTGQTSDVRRAGEMILFGLQEAMKDAGL